MIRSNRSRPSGKARPRAGRSTDVPLLLRRRLVRFLTVLGVAALTVAGALPAQAADNSQVVSHTLPTSLVCGESRQVSITFKNTGTTTWTAAGNYKLGPVGDQDDLYSSGRIPLPSGVSVAPNQNYTFELTLTAPTTPGTYFTDWRMIHVGSGWFGAIASRNVTVSCAGNDADVDSQNLPATLGCGSQTYQASVTMRNTGGTTWTQAAGYKLGPVGDSDPFYSSGRIPLPSGTSVAPGQTHTFNFTLTSNNTPGSYVTDWRMLQVNAGWFGEVASQTVTVSCATADAAVDSQNLPATLGCGGQTYQASVTMRNTGTTTWTDTGNYKLGPVGDSDPFRSGAGRIALPSGTSVAPGQSHTFSFTLTSNNTPGDHLTDWRMVAPGAGWFGEIASQTVTVECVTSPSTNLLRIHPTNKRYLTDNSGKAIVLSGSHTWAVFQDYVNYPPPDPLFDYDKWLDDLEDWNHNFFRGWHWEDGYYEPTPYMGEDSAANPCNPVEMNFSGCKYNLDKINPVYLQTLVDRAREAANRGIYTSIMFFQGWSVYERDNRSRQPDPWEVHPYKAGNHWPPAIDGDGSTTNGEVTHEYPSHDARIIDKQKAYIRAVMDALRTDEAAWNNVIWQITNESHEASKAWQYHMVDYLKTYELSLPGANGKRHLIWTDCFDDGVPTFDSANPADIVSPCNISGYSTLSTNPPAAPSNNKIVIADSDHLNPPRVNRPWVWKSFLRGLHPIVMDAYEGLRWYVPGVNTEDSDFPRVRQAMGGIQVLAEATDLANLVPQAKGTTSPSSNGYSLYRTNGREVLAYHSQAESIVSVCMLNPGYTYTHKELILTGQPVKDTYALVNRPAETANSGGCINVDRGSQWDTVHWLLRDNSIPPNSAPVATIGAPGSGSSVATLESIDFDGSGSFDPDGDPITCSWDFGDGEEAVGELVTHAYSSAGVGSRTVRLTVSDGLAETSTTIQLEVGEAPWITQQPADRVVSLGDDSEFAIDIQGTTLAYLWQVLEDGTWTDLSDGAGISGSATPILTISSVASDDLGAYRCRVSNEFGTATSHAASLTTASLSIVRHAFTSEAGYGLPLDGWQEGAGGLTWTATSNLFVRPSDDISTYGGVYEYGGVPFDPTATNEKVTLSADLIPSGAYWTALGFSETATGRYVADGELWVHLRITTAGQARYRVRANGNEHRLVNELIPGYVEGQFNHVELDYDPLTTGWALRINGVELETGNLEADVGFVPAIQFAGIGLREGTKAQTRVDNFELRRSPAVVRDAFTSDAGGATPLDGWQTGAGGRTWAATSNLFVRPYDEVSTFGGIEENGGIPFDPTVTNEKVTLAADLIPSGSYWTALGFSETATGYLNHDGQLWVHLRMTTSGQPRYRVRADGNTHQFANELVPGYVEGQFNHVELDYDPLTTGWALRINGVELESGNLEADVGFVPAIQFAVTGMREGTQAQTRVDNFELGRSPAVVRDAFTSEAGGGTPLDGWQTGAGGRVWTATSNLFVRPFDEVSTFGGVEENGAVPFDPTATNEKVTLSADLIPAGSYWTSLGFSETATGYLNHDGQLWMHLRITTSGQPRYRVRADGNAHQLANALIPGYVEGQFNHVELDYDPLTTAWALRINGVELESGNLEADIGFVPAIQYAGIGMREGTQAQTRVDNFELTMK